MSETRGLDQYAIGAGFANQPTQADAEGLAGHAAETTTGHLADGHTLAVEQGPIDSNTAKLVDQHRPTLPIRPLPKEIPDCGGLAGAEETADQLGGNVTEHGGFARRPKGVAGSAAGRTQALGRVTPFWPWYLPPRSL